ncbi:hypothetical protein PoB_005363500 [Plakobranchus ocellatus]|uniref:Uncharacterized protein n=1 Tax=Plakobranchus ocellatus TaxID=259542 RepID=A0AAV4C385_9GAST|nr:hypothetical protein PoB_005363500 [Plakobranchus ocellatus]
MVSFTIPKVKGQLSAQTVIFAGDSGDWPTGIRSDSDYGNSPSKTDGIANQIQASSDETSARCETRYAMIVATFGND